MKIVVTGGTGILGTWVVRELLAHGHEATVFTRHALSGEPGARYIAGNVTDLGEVYGVLAGHDAVVHLAAVRRWGIAPDDVVFRTNVVGTYNVNEAAYRLGIKKVVFASSESVTGWDYRVVDFEPEYVPIDEDHPVMPQDSYGLSKEACESICRAYARKGQQTVILRPPWVVPPGDLEQLARDGGRKPIQFRFYCYVDARDCAVAFRLAVEKDLPPATTLFIVADDTALAEPLAEVLPRFVPSVREKVKSLSGFQSGVSNQRAKDLLGWRPQYGWRDLPRA